MADPNIIKVKNYLNSYYGGHSDWMPIETDYTGVVLISGIIRAFQISCNLSTPTGEVGPATLEKMKNMAPIKLMDPEDEPNPFVCLIQCALFAKGYAAGGITGIYYNTGAAAIASLQEDAGLKITKVIDWKVWAALLSFNWFTKAYGGDGKLRTIQQQLNADWSNVIGVQACDGIMSRNTALSLLGALQAALNVRTEFIFNFNELNFGPATTSEFESNVGYLMEGNNLNHLIPLNKLVQYGLYFNGFNPYNFDGNFDFLTKTAVTNFQNKHRLLNNGKDAAGVVGVSTMMSLITSKGDVTRASRGCDCSTVLNEDQIKDLKSSGYQIVGRYLTGTVGVGPLEKSKALTRNEINLLKKHGLSVFAIYQDGGKRKHFENVQQGYNDAVTAIFAANRLGFTKGSTIYFAVDYDCTEEEIDSIILPYFNAIHLTFTQSGINSKNYKVGIYASRQACIMAYEKGYTDYSFVSDMSTWFVGNLGYPLPDNWAFDQFYEYIFKSSPNFDLDKTAVSGLDNGCMTFDEVKEETEIEKLQYARDSYTRNILKSTNLLNKYLGVEFTYDGKELPITTFVSGNNLIEVKFKTDVQFKANEKDYTFNISFDQDGKFSQDLLDKINDVTKIVKDPDSKSSIDTLLKNLALSAKAGSVTVTVVPTSTSSFNISLTAHIDDLFELYGVHGSVSDTLKIEVYFIPGEKIENQTLPEIDLAKMTEASLNALAAYGFEALDFVVTAFEKNPGATSLLIFVIILIVKYGWAFA